MFRSVIASTALFASTFALVPAQATVVEIGRLQSAPAARPPVDNRRPANDGVAVTGFCQTNVRGPALHCGGAGDGEAAPGGACQPRDRRV